LQAWEIEKDALMKEYAREEDLMTSEMEQKIQFEIEAYEKLMKEKKDLLKKNEQIISMLEEDADLEMAAEAEYFDSSAMKERAAALRLREENDISKKKYDVLMKDFNEHKETIASLKEKQNELSNSIVNMQKIKFDREQELKQLDTNILQLDVQINEGTEETHKMERLDITNQVQFHLIKLVCHLIFFHMFICVFFL
jgi:hypothetical protein